jgi:RND family efflux transporter MFP subunit
MKKRGGLMGHRKIRAISVGVASLLWFLGCSSPKPEEGEGPGRGRVPVEVVRVRQEKIPVTRAVSGGVEAYRKASLGTKIMGRVVEIRVHEGDAVKAGELLVRVDVADVAAKKAQAQAALRQAEAMLANAETQFDRIQALYERQSASKKEYDDTKTALDAARAAVAEAESARREAEVSEAYGDIQAPFSGVVTAKLAEPGDMAAPGRPLVVVEDLSRVKIAVQVPEGEIALIHPDMPLSFQVEAVQSGPQTGLVKEIIPAGDPTSRTFDVKIFVDNPEGKLKPGMFARVELPIGEREALLVPAGAVTRKGQLEAVFTPDESGRARLSWVKTGRAFNGRVEILSGLKAGDRVIVSAERPLTDGQPVEISEVSKVSTVSPGSEKEAGE